MSSEISLVTDLAIILIAAGIFTVIARALKQPLILGYIIAGFVVGPHLGLFPQFSTESVHQWSEIGIIFLLFSLGLEFSFKKLLQVGSSVIIMAGCIFAGMFIVGMTIGRAMSWSMMESVFLGGMLSMSSTTIIIKTYDDLGLKNKPYAPLVFGTLVVEDLMAILLMVLLSTMAVSNKFAGGEMLFGIVKLVFFLILWFLVGIYVIPTLLKKAQQYLNDEILLIVSIGLCFAMVSLANLVGFSSALGAFVMGSILSETIEGEHIEHLTGHIKELFGAIFFVSVGMMVDPQIIAQHWGAILVIAIVTMCGIIVFSTSGVLLAGKGLDNAVHTGFSMAQLGEFAFIIAGVGCTLGVLRDFIYPVIIAVSVITAFTTPYVIKLGDPVTVYLKKKLPQNILAKIDPPQTVYSAESRVEHNEWKNLLKSYALRIVLYGVILIAILLLSKAYFGKILLSLLPDVSQTVRNLIDMGITLALMAPFLFGLSVYNGSLSKPVSKLLHENQRNRWPILALMLFRIAIGIMFILTVVLGHFDLAGWSVLLIIVAAVIFSVLAKSTMHKFSGLEDRFLSNFNEKDELLKARTPVTSKVREKLSGYDVHIEKVKVSSDFSYVGKTLREMPFRNISGINIVKIVRGSRSILIPSGNEPVYPGDDLLAVGTTEQLDAFRKMMRESSIPEDKNNEDFVVESLVLTEDSHLTGMKLHDTDMRASGCMVISVVRDGEVITNPRPDFRFEKGDEVWLAGEISAVEWFR